MNFMPTKTDIYKYSAEHVKLFASFLQGQLGFDRIDVEMTVSCSELDKAQKIKFNLMAHDSWQTPMLASYEALGRVSISASFPADDMEAAEQQIQEIWDELLSEQKRDERELRFTMKLLTSASSATEHFSDALKVMLKARLDAVMQDVGANLLTHEASRKSW